MFCRYCGSQLNDNALFCTYCGQRTEQSAQTETVPKKANATKIIVIAAALFVLFCVLCLAGIFLVNRLISGASLQQPSAQWTEPAEQAEQPVQTESTAPSVQMEWTEPPVQTAAKAENPVPTENPYRLCYNEQEFVLPESDSRYYAPADLQNLTGEMLRVAYAEISARHGVAPVDPLLAEYFSCLSWYTPASGAVHYNTFEEQNLFLLDVCIRKRDGSIYHSSNHYIAYLDSKEDFFIANHGNRYITGNELYLLTPAELEIARNEIFARHGYIFRSSQLQEYFCCKDWYRPSVLPENFNSSVFSEYDQANLQLIQVYEKIADGVYLSASNPYAYILRFEYTSNGFIFPFSSSTKLSDSDVEFLDTQELIIARNEIFARNGYCFTDEELMEYFLSCPWYRPQVAPGRLDLISLNHIETANVDFLLKCQREMENGEEEPEYVVAIPND